MKDQPQQPGPERFSGNGLFTRRQALPILTGAIGAGLAVRQAMGQTPRDTHVDRRKDTHDNRGAKIYNVRDYGAVGDGKTLDTNAIQNAIDACTEDGGGMVLISAGVFLIGTLELKSHVTLHIVADGVLLGSGNGKDYHAVGVIPLSGDATLEDGNWALIFAVNAKNVIVEGPGTIDGQGALFHSAVRGVPPPSGLGGHRRPYHLLFYHCEEIRIRNLSLINGAYHSVRVIQSKRVHADEIYIHNRVNGNNDGFHFISAEHVTISNCTVLSLDDACALFGSCRNVTVINSYFSTRWSVFRFGGGNAENVAVSNCILQHVHGCPIKFYGTPGTSYQNMSFANLVMDDVTGPICFSIGPLAPRHHHSGPSPTDALPVEADAPPAIVRNISFSNIHGNVTTHPGQIPETKLTSEYRPGEKYSCITLNCVGDARLENISFENIHLRFGGGGTVEMAARRNLPKIAGEYFMLGPMPAYGFYARNSHGITLNNIRFEVASPELRSALILDHVSDVAINGLSIDSNPQSESALRMIATQDVLITAPRLLTAAKTFLQLEGADNGHIIVDGGDLSRAEKPLVLKDDASDLAVKIRD